MKSSIEKHSISGIFIFLLIALFALCICMVLFAGAKSYRSLTARNTDTYYQRIGIQYVTSKLRHTDTQGAVSVGGFSGSEMPNGDTLLLQETIDGVPYYTRIYCYNGYIRELFTDSLSGYSKADGVEVLPAKNLRFSYDASSGLILICTRDENGEPSSVTLSLRSGKETHL